MPEETAVEELTQNQQLDMLFAKEPAEEAKEAPPTPQASEPGSGAALPAPGAGVETPPAAPEEPAADIEAQLEAIKAEGEDKKPADVALPPEQAEVLKYIPNVDAAREIVQHATALRQLNETIERRDFDAMEKMFAPAAMDAFKEHLYQKYVVSEEWVNRWIAEKEGNPVLNKKFGALEQELKTLKAQLQSRSTQETQAQQAAEKAQRSQGYQNHLNGLFDRIKFNPADRRWVSAAINVQIATNPELAAAVNAGNLKAINGVFAECVNEYSRKDKATNEQKAAALAQQATKKAPIPAGAAMETSDLPEDLKDVPESRLAEWQNRELDRLFAAKR